MANVWYTSDQHLFHGAMAWFRRYGQWPTEDDRGRITDSTISKHNDELAYGWDCAVKPSDLVICVGDLTANNSHLEAALDWINDRPGRKIMVLGNHDPAHDMHREAYKWDAKYYRAFMSVRTTLTRKITLPNGAKVRALVNHFPYTGDGVGREDRCLAYRLPNTGMPLIHGHVHARKRLTHSVLTQSGGGENPYVMEVTPQIHVGVDAWNWGPVSEETVAELIQKGLGYDRPSDPVEVPTPFHCICSGQGGSVHTQDCPIHDPNVVTTDLGWLSRYVAHNEAQAAIKRKLWWT